jgi:hypoxanthine phosphoribosyltransferase
MNVEVAYTGFEIANEFVVGYGLDYAERYRNLPFVGTLAPHVYGGTAEDAAGQAPETAAGPGAGEAEQGRDA